MEWKVINKNITILMITFMILCSGCNAADKEVSSVRAESEFVVEQETSEETDFENTETKSFIDSAESRLTETTIEVNSQGQAETKRQAEMQGQVTETEIAGVEPSSVTLVMVGDMLMHTPVNDSGVMEDGSIDFSHLFTYTKELIEGADIALVNQEIILGGTELGISGYPAFNTYYELGDDLVETGFDVVLHATNHAMDKGKKGIINCASYWENSYPEIAVLGIQDSAQEQEEIYVKELEGIRIAILNYTYGTNGIPLPEDMPYAVNLLDKEKMKADIEKAKAVADFVVVCPHWGTEYVLQETEEQKRYAEFFLECGVDLVIGTHPHVIEPVEMMEDENGHRMLVYYSLGNYVNCTSSETEDIGNRMLGAMAEVTITRGEDGEVYISEYGATPLVTYVSSSQEEIGVYPLDEFTEEMALNSYTIKFDTDFSKKYCEELWQTVMGVSGE